VLCLEIEHNLVYTFVSAAIVSCLFLIEDHVIKKVFFSLSVKILQKYIYI